MDVRSTCFENGETEFLYTEHLTEHAHVSQSCQFLSVFVVLRTLRVTCQRSSHVLTCVWLKLGLKLKV